MYLLPRCYYCESRAITKYGNRKTKERMLIQRFKCKTCKRTFTENKGFKWKHKSVEIILSVLSLYSKGLTIREIADELIIHKNTVLRWIHEYSRKLFLFLRNKKPLTSPQLHLDELYLKMKNTFYYIWDSICKETKFSIIFLSNTRNADDAYELLDESPYPFKLVTDGAFSYLSPIKDKYGVRFSYDAYHRCKDFQDKKNNNLVERLQNTLRRFLHPRRGFNSLRTGIINVNFFWLFYNFIRTHMSIGVTPAEKAGVFSYPPDVRTNKDKFRFLIEKLFFSSSTLN